jgi:hypothetical protein
MVRGGITVSQAFHANAEDRPKIDREAVGARPLEAHGRLGVGPGAVEQAHQTMVKNISEAYEGRIVGVAQPFAGVFGQMDRQRPVGPEQPEEVGTEPRRPDRPRR